MRPSSAILAAAPVALAASVLGLAGAAGGCSSSSGASAAFDASEDYSVPPVEAGGGDGSALPDVDAGPPVVLPRIYLVNASPDAQLLRFCLAAGPPDDAGAVVVAGGMPAWPDQVGPQPSLAGLPPGFGMPFDAHGLDLDALTIDVFALQGANPIVAPNNATTGLDGGNDGALELTCEGLIGSDGLGTASDAGGVLQPGRDFWRLATLPAGMLGHGTTWLAAVTGCVPGETSAAALCPAGYDATAGDLTLATWQLDTTTTAPAGALGAQLVQASSEWDDLASASGGVVSAGFVLPGDGGQVLLATDAGFGALQPATLAQVPGLTFDGTSSFFAQITGADGGPVAPTPLSWTLPAVQAPAWPGAVPEAGVLRDGAGFVFVLVGNPLAPAGSGHTAQALAFPVGNP
jgi:hypothetical protein